MVGEIMNLRKQIKVMKRNGIVAGQSVSIRLHSLCIIQEIRQHRQIALMFHLQGILREFIREMIR